MKIEKIDISKIKPYENNAKLHPTEQIEQIKKSIEQFGNNDPIAVDENNVIIEGHGRYEALKELDYKEVEIIRLTHMTEEQKKAYMLVHNKLTMNSDFDLDLLQNELDNILDIDMEDFGFDLDLSDLDNVLNTPNDDNSDKYTKKTEIPHYEIKGEEPKIEDLVNKEKVKELIRNIKSSNVTQEQKDFLINAAQRHLIFNYKNIAEYYAHQDKEMQELMEQSALVLIDYDDAIKNGFVEVSKEFEDMENEVSDND